MVPPEEHPVFSITPTRITIEPKEAATFLVSGLGHSPADVMEPMECHAASGSNTRATRKAFAIHCHAAVATPLLDFSDRSLLFHVTYAKGHSMAPLTRPLTLRNISKLPLSFALRTASPFSIDQGELSLAPYEYATLNITYDPNPARDLVSTQSRQKIHVRTCCALLLTCSNAKA